VKHRKKQYYALFYTDVKGGLLWKVHRMGKFVPKMMIRMFRPNINGVNGGGEIVRGAPQLLLAVKCVPECDGQDM
jgi:hypothetical protein